MKVYLVILNWVLASALVSCALWLAPLVGGWPLPVGMFIGCMMTAGMVSWEYYKDQSPERNGSGVKTTSKRTIASRSWCKWPSPPHGTVSRVCFGRDSSCCWPDSLPHGS